MTVDSITIKSFGMIEDKTFIFGAGLNIIEGDNETGKSTICAFLQFIFYGFSARSGEREHWLSPTRSMAAGSMDCHTASGEALRIERVVRPVSDVSDVSKRAPSFRESVRITDLNTREQVYEGRNPGELLFGVSADVFSSTAFVRQLGNKQIGDKSVKEAIENILLSADESVSTQRALKKLDEARVFYLHKNKKGGRIYDLETEREQLEERITAAEQQSVHLSEITASIRKLDADRQEKLCRAEHLQRMRDTYDEYTLYQQSEGLTGLNRKAEAADNRARQIQETLSHGGYTPDDAYAAQLRQYSLDIRRTESDEQRWLEEIHRLEVSERQDNLRQDLLQKLESCGGSSTLRTTLSGHHTKRLTFTLCGVLFLILACLSAFLTFVLHMTRNSVGNVSWTVIVSFVLAAAGVFFLINRSKQSRAILDILETFSCGTENELELFFEEASINGERIRRYEESRQSFRKKIEECVSERKRLTEEAAGHLNLLQPPEGEPVSSDSLTADRIESLADRISQALREIKQLHTESAQYRETCQTLKETMHYSAEEEKALKDAFQELFEGKSYAEIDIERIRRELDFCRTSSRQLGDQILNKREEEAKIGISLEDTDLLKRLYKDTEEELAASRKRYRACLLALEKLAEASENLRKTVAPRLSRQAGSLADTMTNGKYRAVKVDAALDFTCFDGERYYQPEQLSAGTQDIMYLSLRMALASVLFRRESVPLIFDESFAHIDDRRIKSILHLLTNSAGEQNQILIFTCHQREAQAAELTRKVTVLKLQ